MVVSSDFMGKRVCIMDQAKSGRFIADKRKEKGMTQKELARQLGIGDKAVSKWECGRGMPVAFTAALFFLIDMPVQMRNNWTYYFDLLTVAMDPILVLVMLLVTGNVKSFFQSFLFLRKENVEKSQLFSSLQAVKLAIVSFLLGGAIFTVFDTIYILGTMSQPAKGLAVTLLTTLYGMLSALFLLPVKYKLESKMEVNT